jgi:hypothetical protein
MCDRIGEEGKRQGKMRDILITGKEDRHFVRGLAGFVLLYNQLNRFPEMRGERRNIIGCEQTAH